jgi:hypothetical protein
MFDDDAYQLVPLPLPAWPDLHVSLRISTRYTDAEILDRWKEIVDEETGPTS